ncbi:NAD(P)-dependent alcohol dehydrogenase [Caulobacter henricii]|uniref:Enoyl reductase (ER) domain-containing protein n=1 Tax=Caulobacter henricii TaxID=69395 RepID=A0A0N7JHU1_9CAUL|nr:NAD(P)-dependent alcohol dehydrogenase [Caulobacter henricii]ALL14338.1 hypothetical protein AQ619_13840 [Caulobacter henricii]
MKAALCRTYGPPAVVRLGEVPMPTPRDHEVLVRIRATTVSSADWRARSLAMPPGFKALARPVFGLIAPRNPILGTELAGEVVAKGKAVTRFRAGDLVFAFTGARFGCHAEFRVLREHDLISHKPANLDFETAAALCFGGTTALGFLSDMGKLKRGEQVLVVGASGCVGSAAVQLARHFGAGVTAVCSAANEGLVRSLGAETVIDYQTRDFAASGRTYDIILDTTGTAPFARCGHLLRPGGRLLVVQGSLGQALGLDGPSRSSGLSQIGGVPKVTLQDLELLAHLAQAGELKPVIDRVYPLEHAAEAHACVEQGHKRGSVVLSIDPS